MGIANHIYDDDSYSSINVHAVDPPDERENAFVRLGNEYDNFIVINSLEQWEQLNAMVRKAFDGLSE